MIVSPGFHRHGGMEKANLALAEHLLERGTPVHLVGHSVDPGLAAHPAARAHVVPRPAASFLLGERSLDRRGRAVARAVTGADPRARVVVNGGNCGWHDVNWVHYVHHAWASPDRGAPLWFRAKNRVLGAVARRQERDRVPAARVVLANSELTRRQLIDLLGVEPGRVHNVYLGSDPAWGLPSARERADARAWLGAPADRPLVAFVGALGYDARKGFDTLLAAWKLLCADPAWDADLVAAGGGRGIRRWEAEVERLGLGGRVRLLGFTHRVPELLAAADLLVSPVRYEAYGLNVQEALCRGLPVVVSGRAGIAERFGDDLAEMILPDPEDAAGLAARLRRWRAAGDGWRRSVQPLGATLRAHTWREMARELVDRVEGPGGPAAPADDRRNPKTVLQPR
ncbi:MAG TPA: glycosyltransferase family 4 protein [Longimicrobiaceae bacterium]|nr:glycosyltransferase family 4 protein [Longimicrobiaceae bacterium]